MKIVNNKEQWKKVFFYFLFVFIFITIFIPILCTKCWSVMEWLMGVHQPAQNCLFSFGTTWHAITRNTGKYWTPDSFLFIDIIALGHIEIILLFYVVKGLRGCLWPCTNSRKSIRWFAVPDAPMILFGRIWYWCISSRDAFCLRGARGRTLPRGPPHTGPVTEPQGPYHKYLHRAPLQTFARGPI